MHRTNRDHALQKCVGVLILNDPGCQGLIWVEQQVFNVHLLQLTSKPLQLAQQNLKEIGPLRRAFSS